MPAHFPQTSHREPWLRFHLDLWNLVLILLGVLLVLLLKPSLP
jgi:hypothetical protein